MASPLTDLTRRGAPDPVQWLERCQVAFDGIKNALCGETVLFAPNFDLPFSLQTDASDRGLGAVLTQQVEDADRPVLYLSRKLSEREGRYSTVEKECLAIRWAVGALRYHLLGPLLHPLFGPRPPAMAPPHEGLQPEDHALVPRVAALKFPGCP